MKLLRPRESSLRRRGAALLLSILVLFVLIAIVAQISIGTMTDARVGRNDVGQTLITRALRSGQYDIFELLKSDAEAEEEGGGGDPMADAASSAMSGEEGSEAPEEPADSRKDEWAMRQRTEINGIQVLIQVEAENAKYNVLNMLNEDEEEAEEAFQRVVRIIDLYREGTEEDIARREAEEMVEEMKRHMTDRHGSGFAEPNLLTFDEDKDTVYLPMSLRDFLVLEPFQEHYFRSYRDINDVRVHSLDQFLTVWSSPSTYEDLQSGGSSSSGSSDDSSDTGDSSGDKSTSNSFSSTSDLPNGGQTNTSGFSTDGAEPLFPEGDLQGGGTGTGSTGDGSSGNTGSGSSGDSSGSTTLGYGVNINLAPAAVLKGLFDDREVRGRFWDDVIEYRNIEEEEEPGVEETEPVFDEFNEEIIDRQAFESVTELGEVRSWDELEPETQARVSSLIETESEVFTIYLTGRRNTSSDDMYGAALTPEERARAEEEPGGALVRTVRVVVWRRSTDDGVEIVPIIPWEELDFTPFEIEDFPDDF